MKFPRFRGHFFAQEGVRDGLKYAANTAPLKSDLAARHQPEFIQWSAFGSDHWAATPSPSSTNPPTAGAMLRYGRRIARAKLRSGKCCYEKSAARRAGMTGNPRSLGARRPRITIRRVCPQEVHCELGADFFNYNRQSIGATVDLPVNEMLALRAVVLQSARAGVLSRRIGFADGKPRNIECGCSPGLGHAPLQTCYEEVRMLASRLPG